MAAEPILGPARPVSKPGVVQPGAVHQPYTNYGVCIDFYSNKWVGTLAQGAVRRNMVR